MNTVITQKLRNFRGDNCVHAEPVCIEAADYIDQLEGERDQWKSAAIAEMEYVELSAQAVPMSKMICNKCEIDRFNEPCPNHQDCPMIAYASARPAKTEQPGLSDALDLYEKQTQALPCQHEIPERGCSTYNWQMAAIRDIRALLSQRQDSVKDAELLAAYKMLIHTHHSEPDGSEFGFCRVKHDQNGRLVSCLWAGHDEVEAAVAAIANGATNAQTDGENALDEWVDADLRKLIPDTKTGKDGHEQI